MKRLLLLLFLYIPIYSQSIFFEYEHELAAIVYNSKAYAPHEILRVCNLANGWIKKIILDHQMRRIKLDDEDKAYLMDISSITADILNLHRL